MRDIGIPDAWRRTDNLKQQNAIANETLQWDATDWGSLDVDIFSQSADHKHIPPSCGFRGAGVRFGYRSGDAVFIGLCVVSRKMVVTSRYNLTVSKIT